ncbi:MAG: hypothetical protein ACI89D_001169 [Bermanella sp.]|jgi:hypothetical protein
MTFDANNGLPPATAYHRTPLRIINGFLRLANALGVARTHFSPEKLMAKASRETGLSDFGDDRFLEPFRMLCEGLNREARLNPTGKLLTRLSIMRLLRHRLLAEDLFAQHPEILKREIKAPVVVVGLARSGTTRLHRLLAADQRFLHLKAWESVNPVPLPASFGAGRDPRIKSIEDGLKAVLYMGPQIASVHPLGAHEVEEEVGLIQHAFSSQLFEVQAYLPSFSAYLVANDQGYAYEYMARLMKLISWWRQDDVAKPWVLKTPQHMQDLDALMHVFPDARLVCTHRDPIKAVGSACSMAWNAIVRDTDSVDPHWIGREWLAKTDAMLRKTIKVRETMVPAQQQIDVLYQNISSDWRSEIERIYQFLGLPLTQGAVAAMQTWLDNNSQHKHGAHKYQLSDFGLSKDEVEEKLSYYRERFAIPLEIRSPHQA